MSDGFTFDFSELDTLAAEQLETAENVGPFVRKAVEQTSIKIKKAWAQKLEGEPRLPHASRSITYDLKSAQLFGKTVLESEIGAETGRLQAPMVTVIEFGAPGNNTAPRGYGHGALQENEADFQQGLEKAVEDAERHAQVDSSVFKSAAAVIRGSYT